MALDCIQITDLNVQCIIGVDEWERRTPQEVIVDLELRLPLGRAGRHDDLTATVDYRALAQMVVEEMSKTSYHLLEAFAERVAELCVNRYGVMHSVRVGVRKPSALAGLGGATVAVVVEREGKRLIRKDQIRSPS